MSTNVGLGIARRLGAVVALPAAAIWLCLAQACDGGSSSAGTGGAGQTTSTTTAGGGQAGAAAAGGTGAAPSAGGGGANGGAGGAAGLTAVHSFVVLGDSIGDGGGVGPFYYELLRQSLADRYGSSLEYHHAAQGGSETDALLGQVNGLPATLPGPVVVTITSGGNDMKAHMAEIIGGVDQSVRTSMGDHIQAALDALLAPNRFGPGVEVHVYEANIYDASDGQGDFNQGGCSLSFPVALPTDGYFTSWNGEISAHVSANGQVLADIHQLFYGHGFNHPPNWYASDCIHPNSTGHDQLRRMFYELITGETLP